MRKSLKLFAAAIAALALTGCASDFDQQAAYVTPITGEFGEAGQFSSTMALVVDYSGGTFNGVMRNFQFSEGGFAQPAGTVAISGTVTEATEDEGWVLMGTGQGVLRSGNLSYNMSLEMESAYIPPNARTVNAFFFGGGEFNRGTSFLRWTPLNARFDTRSVCRTSIFDQTPCPLPQ